ncbi:MAG: hypothetical protein IT186_13310 [Acidobacteria bacterium]|nr:hypothetical protein [Acidobacteriota bacterium]
MPFYASGSWTPLPFGLGPSTRARVSVMLPDGTVQDLGTLAAGRYRVLKRKTRQEALNPSPSL